MSTHDRLRRESRRRLRRLASRVDGETGIALVGRFSLSLMSLSRHAKAVAVVEIDGRKADWVSQMRRGPRWIPIQPSKRHELRILGLTPEPHHLNVTAQRGEIWLLFVEPKTKQRPPTIELKRLNLRP